jgi:aldehyde dehydrogenase (NAD+)/betaine-aldehyde dehydrogenase
MDPKSEMGPISNFKQLEIIEKNIKLTEEQGGKIKCGGKRHSFSNEGYYFPPTIIECNNHNLPTAENELFGPILSVMKFETEEEVINKMNDNKYGLSSGGYGKEAGVDSIKDYTRVKTTWYYTSDKPTLDPFSMR